MVDSRHGGGVRRARARGGRDRRRRSPAWRSAGPPTSEALRDAKQLTRDDRAERGRAGPHRSRSLTGDPAALARLDRAVRTRVLRSPGRPRQALDARRPDRVLRRAAADRPPLRARRRRAARARARGGVDADVSDATQPENVFERGLGKLLEVYLPVRTPDGRRLLYEEYLRYARDRRQQPAPVARAAARVRRRAARPRARPAAARVVAGAAPAAARGGARGAARAARRVVGPRAPAAGPGAARGAGPGGGRAGVAPRARPRGGPDPPLAGELAARARPTRARPCARCARCSSRCTRPTSAASASRPRCADIAAPLRAAGVRGRPRRRGRRRPGAGRRGARLPRRRGGAAQRPPARPRPPRRRCACATTTGACAPDRSRRRSRLHRPTSSPAGAPAGTAGSRSSRTSPPTPAAGSPWTARPAAARRVELDAPSR